jgi:hypothetical protein
MKRWTGTLNDQQQALIDRWVTEHRLTGQGWVDYRQQWRSSLAEALGRRRATPDCRHLAATLMQPIRDETHMKDVTYNEALWNQLVADVAAAMDEQQHRRAKEKLLQLARHIDELAGKPVS